MSTTGHDPEAAAAAGAGPRSAGGGNGSTTFRVTVSKHDLVFCAGHFITYDEGGECESLHGHNYLAGVTLWGDVNEDAYVYDFVALKERMRELVDALDHCMLLPRDNPDLQVSEEEGEVTVRHGDRRYVFPAADVVILPVPNTTAEMLAGYLLDRIVDDLLAGEATGVHAAEVEVEESAGQSGWARRSLEPGS